MNVVQILNPQAAIAAREELNLSQTKVAQDIGLSRSYLSQFESGKRILEDRWQEDLVTYYESHGWKAPDPSITHHKQAQGANTVCARDGFVVSQDLPNMTVEELLGEYYDNAQELEERRSVEVPRGFFGGVNVPKAMQHVLGVTLLTSRQCEIKRLLHGEIDLEASQVLPDLDDITSIGEYVDHLYANNFETEAA